MTTALAPSRSPKKPVTAVLDLFSSIWLGVVLLTVIFLYSSIGSALPPNSVIFSPREYFEKTEMEWFTWWPFNVMIALFALNLTVATLRRIPLKATTAGVWMIHTGILIMCAGSVYYFANKIEGSAPVFRRQIQLEVPGGARAQLLCMPGVSTRVRGEDGVYQFRVKGVEPEWPLPTAEGDSQTAYRVNMEVDGPGGRFVRHIVAGHPQLTENESARARFIEGRRNDAKASVRLDVQQGAAVQLSTLNGAYELQVMSINPNWPLLTGADKGKRALAVQVAVKGPEGEFVRQLLEDYPQYTEDILPGKGRAINAIGRKLVDESLELTMQHVSGSGAEALAARVQSTFDYVPQSHAYLAETAAMYYRLAGATEWTQRPIEGLPHFQDHFESDGDVWNPQVATNRSGGLDIPLETPSEQDLLGDFGVRVISYLRYAVEQPGWAAGGSQLYPVVRLGFEASTGEKSEMELAAFDPQRRMAEDGRVQFRWVTSTDEIERIKSSTASTLTIQVGEDGAELEVPVEVPDGEPDERPFIDIPDTEFAYRIRHSADNWRSAQGGIISLAVVDIRTPEGVITRYVADDPTMTKDSSEGPHTDGAHGFRAPDPRITMTYEPATASMVTLLAGPEPIGLHVLINATQTGRQHLQPKLGERVTLTEDVSMRISEFFPHARLQDKPVLAARERQERGAMLFMVQIELAQADWVKRIWLPFSQYALPDSDYASRKIPYRPKKLALPDGRELELLYSRERVPLPAEVALEDFTLLTHQGGLIGRNANIRNYISRLRFKKDDGWSEPLQMSLNAPAVWNGYSFFQSTWDAPTGPEDPGMSFTGCGIGTRGGVYTQLIGTIIAVIGMIYTFYVKPIIIRRRRLAVYGQLEREGHPAAQNREAVTSAPAEALQPLASTSDKGEL